MELLEFFKNRRVLITGHTGFKGSWLCRILVNAGAARMILDKDLTAERLETEIEEIIQQDGVLQQMGNKAKTIAKDNVENRIYQEIKKL